MTSVSPVPIWSGSCRLGTLTARDPEDAARLLAEVVAPGDVVLTLGAGSITDTGPLLLELLASARNRAAGSDCPLRNARVLEVAPPGRTR